MSDQHPLDPDDLADLVASRAVDGDLDEAELASLGADPDLEQRIAEFTAVTDRLTAPEVPDGLADRQIGAALDLFDSLGLGATDAAASAATSAAAAEVPRHAEVVPLRRRTAPAWLGAAAVAALVVGGVGIVASGVLGGGDDDAAIDIVEDRGDALRTDEAADGAESAAVMESDDAGDDAMEDDAADDAAMDEAMESEPTEGAAAEDAGDDAAMADEDDAMEDDAEDDEGGDAGAAEDPRLATLVAELLGAEDAAAFYAANGPVDLDGPPEASVVDLIEVVRPPLVEGGPCADDPPVPDSGVVASAPVRIDGAEADLVILETPAGLAAVVVDEACSRLR